MNYKLASVVFVLLTTGVLSLGQAWALHGGATRTVRHAVVWVAASLTMLAVAYVVFDLGHAPPARRQAAVLTILLLAGCLAAVALWAGTRWGGAKSREAPDWRAAAAPLAGIHAAVVTVGGGLATVVFVVWALASIQW